MKILAIGDVESKYFYDYYYPGKLDDFDLIIACGDLHRSYLEFLVTMARCPLLYVCGNHDDGFADEPVRQSRWKSFVKKKRPMLPVTLEETIDTIKHFLLPVIFPILYFILFDHVILFLLSTILTLMILKC